MISFSHIYKVYPGPNYALRDINLKIDHGEFIFIIGESGAGKTTLFRLISAFEKPTSGRLSVLNNDLGVLSEKDRPYFRRGIGVIYQDFRLLKDYTVFENIALPLEVIGYKKSYVVERVHEMLKKVGLHRKGNVCPDELSGGEQQRVAIARALVHKPEILIADEPTGNLDPALSEQILKLLEEANQQGTTVVIATHDHSMVKSRNHRVIELQGGAVLPSSYNALRNFSAEMRTKTT